MICLAGCGMVNDAANKRLFEACDAKSPKGVQAALDSGADPNAIDHENGRGFTALEEGLETPEIVSILLKAGAVATKPDLNGMPMIAVAASIAPKESVEMLLSAGAGVEDSDTNGDAPLAKAVEFGKMDNASVLLAKGANVNDVDKFGYTPLICAIRGSIMDMMSRGKGKSLSGPVNMIRLLLDRGADPSIKDLKGNTAADYAQIRFANAGDTKRTVLNLLAQAARRRKKFSP